MANRYNFRPIALNSILGKVLEKLLNNRLYFFLTQHKLLVSNQYGFTHKTSTVHALENIKEDITEAQGKKNKVIIISLDIKNAFGQIRKSKIERILKDLRIPVNIFNCIIDVIHNRKILYEMGNEQLIYNLKEGSPQ